MKGNFMTHFKRTLTAILCTLLLITLVQPAVFATDTPELLPFVITSSQGEITTDLTTATITLSYPADTQTDLLYITPKETNQIRLFAAPGMRQPITMGKNGLLTVTMAQKYTTLYLHCKVENTITKYTLHFISPRSPVLYRDMINVSDWALPYLNFCNENGLGIIRGNEKGDAAPLDFMTRYEIATVSTRFLATDRTQFSLAKLNYSDELVNWAEDAVNALTQMGIISGHKIKNEYYYSGDSNVTRQEVAKILVNMLLLHEKYSAQELYDQNKEAYEQALSLFADEKSIAPWARPYVAVAICHYKFLNGSKENGKLYIHPDSNITRQEMTAMIARRMGYDANILLDNLIQKVQTEIPDFAEVPAVLQTPLKAAYNKAFKVNTKGTVQQKELAYSKLYIVADLIFRPRLVYLSPSRQMANAYTGIDTNEGAQMQAIAARLQPMLEAMGFVVYMAKVETTLEQRAAEAKELGADIYVSIHSNATGTQNNGQWQGSIVFHSNNPGSQQLAQSISKYVSALTPTNDKGIRNEGNAYVPYTEIILPQMANILAEVEYHDYAQYARWIYANKRNLAQAFANGILDYFLRK